MRNFDGSNVEVARNAFGEAEISAKPRPFLLQLRRTYLLFFLNSIWVEVKAGVESAEERVT